MAHLSTGSHFSPALLPDLPPISALFLIEFDVKAGYTIAWKQAHPGLTLDGIVEYKSLPSGLHTVPEDLIYFVHGGGHAGLSAFVNSRTEDEQMRNARMIAVGVLVPLTYGRLGRAWRHAEGLKEMVASLSADAQNIKLLEAYWEKNKVHETLDTAASQPLKDSPMSSPSLVFQQTCPGLTHGHIRMRSVSDGAALLPPGHRLSSLHPARSLTRILDTFGPLIFPIYRAALLRKRILISTHAPVHEACNFVYDISILSNIPSSVYDVIHPAAPTQRLQPLFNIGIYDLPSLLDKQTAPIDRLGGGSDEGDMRAGWIACTTDSILAVKENLWDMLIIMPPSHSVNAKDKVWPTVECPKGVTVKATQRDLRRFRKLRLGLTLVASSISQPKDQANSGAGQTASSELHETGTAIGDGAVMINEGDIEKIVESTTWAALAYNGFMWWASAGEQRHTDEAEEAAHDASLLADLAPPMPYPSHRRASLGRRPSSAGAALTSNGSLVDSVSSLTAGRADGKAGEDDDEARVEFVIIAYFHRLTTSILTVLAEVVDTADDNSEDERLGADMDLASAAASTSGPDEREDAALLGNIGERDGEDDERSVHVDSDALAHMGLDVWSASDAEFVRQVMARYLGLRSHVSVETKGIEFCGLHVC